MYECMCYYGLCVCVQEFVGIFTKTAFGVIETASCMKNKVIRAQCVQVPSPFLSLFGQCGQAALV